MDSLPQNILNLLSKLLKYGYKYPDKIIKCKENQSCKYYNIYGNDEHCIRDKLIYNLDDGNIIVLKYNNGSIAIEIRENTNFYTSNYLSINYCYNITDILKYLEKYSELFELDIKEPEE